MRLTTSAALASLAVLCLVLGGLGLDAAAAKDKADTPKPHADKLVKEALKRFDVDYGDDDMDKRLRIVKWLGMHRHKKVISRLRKIWLKEGNLELVQAAGAALGAQISHPRVAAKVVLAGLEKHAGLAGKMPANEQQRMREDLEASVIVTGLQSYQALGLAVDWKKMKGFLDHNSDEVAIAMIKLCEVRKEYKSLPVIYQWFEHYPDGASWSGGSVKVDTGAAGSKDQRAAKAKWGAKYGGRAKKGRPNAFRAMVECVQVLTGEKIEKRDQLKAWMKANKVFLKKQGV